MTMTKGESHCRWLPHWKIGRTGAQRTPARLPLNKFAVVHADSRHTSEPGTCGVRVPCDK